jgi:hypothetical protein
VAGESGIEVLFMFPDSALKIIGYPGIKSCVVFVGHDVNTVLFGVHKIILW